jgi:hypothetical protein
MASDNSLYVILFRDTSPCELYIKKNACSDFRAKFCVWKLTQSGFQGSSKKSHF